MDNGSVLILCVNYNSYEELNNYLESIDKACDFVNKKINVEVKIADNTHENLHKIDLSRYKSFSSKKFLYNVNHGYMGAVMKLIKDTGEDNVKKYDYVIISNVDLILSESFFEDLFSTSNDNKIGWIAPQIFSLLENRDRNPKMINRPSLKKMELLLLKYKYPILHYLYTYILYPFMGKKMESYNGNNSIYAGHGSIMIFTKEFMKENVSFKYHTFLFGEEIFFGELVKKSSLKVVYNPKIRVNDIDHASTSKLKSKDYFKMNYDSINKLKILFENE